MDSAGGAVKRDDEGESWFGAFVTLTLFKIVSVDTLKIVAGLSCFNHKSIFVSNEQRDQRSQSRGSWRSHDCSLSTKTPYNFY